MIVVRKRDFYLLIFATLLLYVALGLIGLLLWSANRDRITEGQQAHMAICVLAVDLKNRVKRDQDDLQGNIEFLKDNPNGIPGISPALLRSSINSKKLSLSNEKSTLLALKKARCP